MHTGTNRTTFSARWSAAGALVATCVVGATACGTGLHTQVGAATGPTVEVVAATGFEPATTASTPMPAIEVAGEWTWALETPDGRRTEATLALGAAQHVWDVQVLPGFDDPESDLLSACGSFDPAGSAVIPAGLVLRNGTQGLASSLSSSLFLVFDHSAASSSRSDGDQLAVAMAYGDGVDCTPIGTADEVLFGSATSWDVSHATETGPGEAAPTRHAYLILPHYYGPDTPDGDTSRLEHMGLGLVSAMREDEAELVELDGPDSTFGPTQGTFFLGSLAAGDAAEASAGRVNTGAAAPPEPPVEDSNGAATDSERSEAGQAPAPPEPELDLAGCPEVRSGTWSGSWISPVAGLEGTVTVDVQLDETTVDGSLDLRGPSHATLVDSGPLSGTRECLTMSLSVADDTLELFGDISADGSTFSGTYEASLDGGTIEDSGSFVLRLDG